MCEIWWMMARCHLHTFICWKSMNSRDLATSTAVFCWCFGRSYGNPCEDMNRTSKSAVQKLWRSWWRNEPREIQNFPSKVVSPCRHCRQDVSQYEPTTNNPHHFAEVLPEVHGSVRCARQELRLQEILPEVHGFWLGWLWAIHVSGWERIWIWEYLNW